MLRLLKLLCVVYGLGLIVLSGWLLLNQKDGESTAWMIYTILDYLPSETGKLYRVRWDGSETQFLSQIRLETKPILSSELNKIYFSKSGKKGLGDLFVMNIDGSDLQNLTPTLVDNGAITLSTDSQWVFFVSRNSGFLQLYRMKSDGSHLQNISHSSMRDDYGANITPDNQWLVFGANDNGNQEIYRMRVDGNEQLSLSQSPDWDTDPQITPDGKWVIFTSNRVNSYKIYRVRLDGSELVNLTQMGVDEKFTISADSQWLIFNSRGDVYRMRIDGSKLLNLTQSLREHSAGSIITSDNQWVIFGLYNQTQYDIYRVGLDGSQPEKLLDTDCSEFPRLISSDNQWLIFSRDCGSKHNLYRMRLDGSELVQLSHNQVGQLGSPLLLVALPDMPSHRERWLVVGIILLVVGSVPIRWLWRPA